jgi:hypothetical protein
MHLWHYNSEHYQIVKMWFKVSEQKYLKLQTHPQLSELPRLVILDLATDHYLQMLLHGT